MRSSIVSVLLALSLVAACNVGDGGGGGGGGVDGGGGDVDAPTATPRLDVTIDKPTIATELGTSNMITVTLTSSGGFTGPVTLTASAVDSSGVAVRGWTIGLNQTTVNVPAGGTATAVATLAIGTENRGLAGTVKIDASSSLGSQTLTSAVTALNQLTINVTENGNNCTYPSATAMKVVIGTKVRFVNKFAADNITIHSNGGTQGVAHESDPGHAPNTAYEDTFSATGTFDWYCHAPGPNLNGNNPRFQVLQ